MSGFGEWRAHAQLQGPLVTQADQVVLSIGREIAPDQWDVVTGVDADSTLVQNQSVPEGTGVPAGLSFPPDIAEAIYHALHRLYGHENQEGKIEALQEALNVERSRVNAAFQAHVINRLPAHQVT